MRHLTTGVIFSPPLSCGRYTMPPTLLSKRSSADTAPENPMVTGDNFKDADSVSDDSILHFSTRSGLFRDENDHERARLSGRGAASLTTSSPSSVQPPLSVSLSTKRHVWLVFVFCIMIISLSLEFLDVSWFRWHQSVQNATATKNDNKIVLLDATHEQFQSNQNNYSETLSEKSNNHAYIDPLFSPPKIMTTMTFSIPTSVDGINKSHEMINQTYEVSQLVLTQIAHFQNGSGLILHIHVTHHGGTSFCGTFRQVISAPPFACRTDTSMALSKLTIPIDQDYPTEHPWPYHDTARNIAEVRRYFQLLSWEYYVAAPDPPLRETNWEHPNLLSVIVMRHPISRLLAGDGWVATAHPKVYNNTATEDEWWAFAKDSTRNHTDNFALRILAGRPCCNGKDTDRKFLEYAKALVSRFSFVLDINCLDESMTALSQLLGVSLPRKSTQEMELLRQRHEHPPLDRRIPFSNVYEYLLERNRLDIELYEWSKNISLVNCEDWKKKATTINQFEESNTKIENPLPPQSTSEHPSTSSLITGGVRPSESLAPDDPLYHPRKIMTTVQVGNSTYTLTELALNQVQNYQIGTGLLLHIHITHHAGTAFCGAFSQVVTAPPFACRTDNWLSLSKLSFELDKNYPTRNPWPYKDTAYNIAKVRQYFQLLSWEYYIEPPNPPLRVTNWENPNLVSIIVMREPIERLLAGDGWVSRNHTHVYLGNATEGDWWAFANSSYGHTDNFALRTLAGSPCCNGKDTDRAFLEYAKALVSRFSFVLDQDCLNEGMDVLSNLLGVQLKLRSPRDIKNQRNRDQRPPVSERIPFRNVYEYLLERNRLDIELYEWSKTRSLVNCEAQRRRNTRI